MSIKVVKAEIDRFLRGSEPEVLCISGKWGVGKTYSWNFYLAAAKKKLQIGLTRYAYVSLFGLKTLDELKYALYEATKPVERIGEEVQWNDLDPQKATAALENPLRRIVSSISRVPFIQNYIGIPENILFYFVGKQLICIDDIERAGEGLNVNDVFGLVSFLKEQRKCRVVLLLNEEEIDKRQKEVFEKQFEKIVDTHLQFDPQPEEAAEIVFPSREGMQKQLYEHCVTLRIQNIRVIKKIEKIANRLREILEDKYEELIPQAIHSATLFAWARYQRDGQPPPFDFLKDVGRLHGFFRDENKVSEDEKQWRTLMAEYKFTSMDDFDKAIYDIVESGVFNEAVLISAAQKQSQGVTKSKQEQIIRDTWGLYHGSFDDNETEVMDAIYNITLNNMKATSPSNLDVTVRMLNEFDRAEDAENLLTQYIAERADEKELYDLESNPFGSEIRDPELREAFRKKLLEFTDDRNPADVLESMIRNHGWSLEDRELIDKLTVDDLYKIFKQEKGDRLRAVMRASMMLNADGSGKESVAQKAIRALERIAGENRLNAKRVSAYGIQLKPK
jgi:hypothetical protein